MATKTMTRPAKARKLSEDARLADEIITDYPLVEAAKKPAKRIEKARKELLELLETGAGPDEELTAHGTLGDVTFSAASEVLQCTDIRKVHELLGDDFYEVAKVTIGDLRDYLTPRQLDSVTKPCMGGRRMAVVPSAIALPGQDRVGSRR